MQKKKSKNVRIYLKKMYHVTPKKLKIFLKISYFLTPRGHHGIYHGKENTAQFDNSQVPKNET